MVSWKRKFLSDLQGFGTPRVMTTRMISEMVEDIRPRTTPATVARFIKEAEEIGFLRRVRSGLFLNTQAFPGTVPAEAAPYIRSGAVVSLHTVLGDAGILNNPTPMVFCVVPLLKEGPNPSVGEVRGHDTWFHFSAVPERVLYAGAEEDRIASQLYPLATSEAALCHWIYLANSPFSKLTEPPLDCDLESVDRDRLALLAREIGIEDHVEEWVARVDEYNETMDDHNEWGPF